MGRCGLLPDLDVVDARRAWVVAAGREPFGRCGRLSPALPLKVAPNSYSVNRLARPRALSASMSQGRPVHPPPRSHDEVQTQVDLNFSNSMEATMWNDRCRIR